MKGGYVCIQDWMYEVELGDLKELVAFAIIFGFSQDGESKFQGSLQHVARKLKCSKPTAISVLKSLEDKGLIEKEQITIQGVTFNRYNVPLQVVKNFNYPSKDSLPNNNINNNITSPNGDIVSKEPTLFKEDNTSITPYSPPCGAVAAHKFEEFRRAYKGTKRGAKTEYENFKKKYPKDYCEIADHILADYLRQEEIRESNRKAGAFVPQPKNLQTYINQRCWEEEIQLVTSNPNDYARQSFDREVARRQGAEAARTAALDACITAGINAANTERGYAEGY